MSGPSSSDRERKKAIQDAQDALPNVVESKWQYGESEYGDAWLDAHPHYCLDRMEEEFYEFRQAVDHYEDPEKAMDEIADMINYGLMFAVLSGLWDSEAVQDGDSL